MYKSILKAKVHSQPGLVGFVLHEGLTFQNRVGPARGDILTAEYQATSTTAVLLLAHSVSRMHEKM